MHGRGLLVVCSSNHKTTLQQQQQQIPDPLKKMPWAAQNPAQNPAQPVLRLISSSKNPAQMLVLI